MLDVTHRAAVHQFLGADGERPVVPAVGHEQVTSGVARQRD